MSGNECSSVFWTPCRKYEATSRSRLEKGVTWGGFMLITTFSFHKRSLFTVDISQLTHKNLVTPFLGVSSTSRYCLLQPYEPTLIMSYLVAYAIRVAYSYRCNNIHDEQIAGYETATPDIRLPVYTYHLERKTVNLNIPLYRLFTSLNRTSQKSVHV